MLLKKKIKNVNRIKVVKNMGWNEILIWSTQNPMQNNFYWWKAVEENVALIFTDSSNSGPKNFNYHNLGSFHTIFPLKSYEFKNVFIEAKLILNQAPFNYI